MPEGLSENIIVLEVSPISANLKSTIQWIREHVSNAVRAFLGEEVRWMDIDEEAFESPNKVIILSLPKEYEIADLKAFFETLSGRMRMIQLHLSGLYHSGHAILFSPAGEKAGNSFELDSMRTLLARAEHEPSESTIAAAEAHLALAPDSFKGKEMYDQWACSLNELRNRFELKEALAALDQGDMRRAEFFCKRLVQRGFYDLPYELDVLCDLRFNPTDPFLPLPANVLGRFKVDEPAPIIRGSHSKRPKAEGNTLDFPRQPSDLSPAQTERYMKAMSHFFLAVGPGGALENRLNNPQLIHALYQAFQSPAPIPGLSQLDEEDLNLALLEALQAVNTLSLEQAKLVLADHGYRAMPISISTNEMEELKIYIEQGRKERRGSDSLILIPHLVRFDREVIFFKSESGYSVFAKEVEAVSDLENKSMRAIIEGSNTTKLTSAEVLRFGDWLAHLPMRTQAEMEVLLDGVAKFNSLGRPLIQNLKTALKKVNLEAICLHYNALQRSGVRVPNELQERCNSFVIDALSSYSNTMEALQVAKALHREALKNIGHQRITLEYAAWTEALHELTLKLYIRQVEHCLKVGDIDGLCNILEKMGDGKEEYPLPVDLEAACDKVVEEAQRVA